MHRPQGRNCLYANALVRISCQKAGPDDKLRAVLARRNANPNKHTEDHTRLVMRSTEDIDLNGVTEQDP